MVYSETFCCASPRPAVSSILQRLKKIKALEDEVLEFCREKVQVDDSYARALNKLVKKPNLQRREREKDSMLGDLVRVWSQVVANANESSKCHTLLSERMAMDIDGTLRTRESFESEWNQLKLVETNLNRMMKDYEEKEARFIKHRKRVDDERTPKNDQKDRKFEDAKTNFEAIVTAWKSESKPIFDKLETIDRSVTTGLRSYLEKLVRFHVDNLKIQVMNLEQTLELLQKIEPDNELANFIANHGKEMEASADAVTEKAEPTNEIKKRFSLSISSSSKQSTSEPKPATEPDIQVDADGYRIPQMDAAKWRSEMMPSSELSDDEGGDGFGAQLPSKIKIDIKNEGTPVKAEDLTQAVASLSFKPSASVSKRSVRRRSMSQNGAESPRSEKDHSWAMDLNEKIQFSETIPSVASNTQARSLLDDDFFGGPIPSPLAAKPMTLVPIQISPSPGGPVSKIDVKKWLKKSGLQLTIQEVVTATVTKDQQVQQVQVNGTLSACFRTVAPADVLSQLPTLRLRLDGKTDQCLIESPSLINTANAASNYDIHVSQIPTIAKPVILLRYRSETSPSNNSFGMRVSARWRSLPRQSQLAILCEAPIASNSISCHDETTGAAKITELSILVTTDDDASAIVTRPTAAWNQEKKKLLWKLPRIELGDSGGQNSVKFLAQWDVDQRSEQVKGIAMKYLCTESRIGSVRVHVGTDDQQMVELNGDHCVTQVTASLWVEPSMITVDK